MSSEDHIDRFLEKIPPGVGIDLEVEGIVDRIGGISRRIHAALKETLAEYDLTPEDWSVMCSLRLRGGGHGWSPGALASDHELSSGAMTSRLDRLEKLGHVRR